jgi:CBS domain-containing protein
MTTPVITVAPHATLAEATELLLQHGISGLPVIDLAGRIVGMFSELDEGKSLRELLSIFCGAAILDEGGHNVGNITGSEQARANMRARADHRVKDYMTTEVIVVNENEPATRVVDLFISHRVHRLPVMRGHELIGVIGVRDVVQFIRELEAKLGAMSH